MALTKAQQREAADLIQRILDLIDEGHLAADGPTGVALARRLEGGLIALKAAHQAGVSVTRPRAQSLRARR